MKPSSSVRPSSSLKPSSLTTLPLGQRLGPVARLPREVGTGVLGKVLDRVGVVGGEPDPEDAAPADGELSQPDAHSLVALHRPVAGIYTFYTF